MKLVYIKKEYTDYLRKFDKKVINSEGKNYKNNRVYLGVVLEVNIHKYFVPLSSKISSYNKRTSFLIKDEKNESYGVIKFNNMIPVNESEIVYVDFKQFENTDKKYLDLLKKEYQIISQNKNTIKNKSKKIYESKINNESWRYSNICCDFKLLEKKCIEYNKLINKQKPKIKM